MLGKLGTGTKLFYLRCGVCFKSALIWRNGRRGRLKICSCGRGTGSSPVIGRPFIVGSKRATFRYISDLFLYAGINSKNISKIISYGTKGVHSGNVLVSDQNKLYCQMRVINNVLDLISYSSTLHRFVLLCSTKTTKSVADQIFKRDPRVSVCTLEDMGSLQVREYTDKSHYLGYAVREQPVCVIILGFSRKLVKYQLHINRFLSDARFPVISMSSAHSVKLFKDYILAVSVDSTAQAYFWLQFIKCAIVKEV